MLLVWPFVRLFAISGARTLYTMKGIKMRPRYTRLYLRMTQAKCVPASLAFSTVVVPLNVSVSERTRSRARTATGKSARVPNLIRRRSRMELRVG